MERVVWFFAVVIHMADKVQAGHAADAVSLVVVEIVLLLYFGDGFGTMCSAVLAFGDKVEK